MKPIEAIKEIMEILRKTDFNDESSEQSFICEHTDRKKMEGKNERGSWVGEKCLTCGAARFYSEQRNAWGNWKK